MIHEYIIREHELMEAHDQYLDDIDCVNSEAPGKISVHPCCAVVAFLTLILNTKLYYYHRKLTARLWYTSLA